MATKRWFQASTACYRKAGRCPAAASDRRPTLSTRCCRLDIRCLFHRVQAACQAWGLDPAMGFFHEYRPGRASLACDLMEPFRVPAVDRLVLRMLALKRYHEKEFIHNEGDFSVRMIEEALKRWTNRPGDASPCRR